MDKQPQWSGYVPRNCQVCQTEILKVFVDGKTKQGPWGIMCPDCHNDVGIGFGTGCGQQYRLQPDGTWVKTCG